MQPPGAAGSFPAQSIVILDAPPRTETPNGAVGVVVQENVAETSSWSEPVLSPFPIGVHSKCSHETRTNRTVSMKNNGKYA